MVNGYCFTRVPGYEEEIWPTVFEIVPQRGYYVESRNGKRLQVGEIILSYDSNEKPCVKLDLVRGVYI